MLDANSRQVYLDALKPPVGYRFDRAITTTFSLDLMALLVAPMSFSLFDINDQAEALREPVAILEALRRTSERISVFCQRGRISVPSPDNLLYSYLEKMVVEVQPAGSGVFHPKLWFLRFIHEQDAPIYRLLCLSRNLTFDRSWDTVLTIDGGVSTRPRGKNRPLADFLRFLPTIAVTTPDERVLSDIDEMAEEIRYVDFVPPSPFEDMEFLPLGMSRRRIFPFPGGYKRLLVVSPFVSDRVSIQIANSADTTIIVSRVESLDQLDPETRKHFSRIYTIEETGDEPEEQDGTEDASLANSNRGLHAKLYITENGWNADLWTGSANATNAAFRNNIEFLVKMSGKRSQVGIDALLQQDSDSSLLHLLCEYQEPNKASAQDPVLVRLQQLVESAREAISIAGLRLQVECGEDDTYNLALLKSEDSDSLHSDLKVKCWPVTLNESRAVDASCLWECGRLGFGNVSFAALTSFVAFEVTADDGATTCDSVRFVLNLPVTGMPDGRSERVLQEIICNKDRFIRYLLFLLSESEDDDAATALRIAGHIAGIGSWENWLSSVPLLEELVRAFSRYPDKMGRIASMVKEIQKNPRADEVLPHGFADIWRPFEEELIRRSKDE
ncbi:MAG: phospholipase D family protein [Armatimonadota bacterium]|nr:phospholipase D family protein [bacterium]